MRFDVLKIILWPRHVDAAPRIVTFEPGRLNVITGWSRTGKSAIIPIIDYCLGAERCTIPIGVIRETTNWFGVLVRTDEGEKLFARREPELQQSTDEMYLQEARSITEIPNRIKQNTTRDAVKQRLDHLAGLTNLDFGDEHGSSFGRPSFRDVMAFVFQPQNIVANPNVLFYKADTVEHRQKLRAIFPYVLGAVSGETLARRHELQQLQRELRRKEHELATVKALSERWQSTIQARLAEARDLGLISREASVAVDRPAAIAVLRQVSEVRRPDLEITAASLGEGVEELNRLHSEEAELANQLTTLRRRFAEMEQLRTNASLYEEALGTQRDRLHLSRWLQDHAGDAACPICGNGLTGSAEQVAVLVKSLEAVEHTAARFSGTPPSFDRELERVRGSIGDYTERLRGIRIRQSALERRSEEAQQRQYSILAASRFIGGLESDLKTFESVGQDGELQDEVETLRAQVTPLEQRIATADVAANIRRALTAVSANAARLLPLLDAENPEKPVSLSETELTVKVQSRERDDFLWEIGSGSNWLSYHVAVALALQQYFLTLPRCPVPAFLVFDQPSQVYFPRRLAERPGEDPHDPEWRDQDVEAVTKILGGMAAAIAASGQRLQIIVLDHAPESVWGALPLVHKVEEWRDGRALIPEEWINR